MKKLLALLIVMAMLGIARVQAVIPQQIEYQGVLAGPDGIPLDTTVTMTFALYYEGNDIPLWTETHPAVSVANGTFHARLGESVPLSDSFFGGPRWLGLRVGTDLELQPRLPIASTPYAFRVGSVDGANGGTLTGNVNVTGKVCIGPGNVNTGTNAFVAGQSNEAAGQCAVTGGGRNNHARGSYSTIGGGGGALAADSNSAAGTYTTIGGGTRNDAGGQWATIGGGFDNSSTESATTVGGGYQNVAGVAGATVGGGYYNEADATSATIAGGYDNFAAGYASTVGGGRYNQARGRYSVICGGGGTSYADSNSACGDYSTIAGGRRNTAADTSATVGGGERNEATENYTTVAGGYSNLASYRLAAVGGGSGNTASNNSAVVAGGYHNTASGAQSTVGGGYVNSAAAVCATVSGGNSNQAGANSATVGGGNGNTASGLYSTVPGGNDNTAAGAYSLAAGSGCAVSGARSFALGTNITCAAESAFVWSDGSGPVLSIGSSRTFSVKATNGTRIWTNSALSSGVTIGAGGSAWTSVSDSTKKRNIRGLDTRDILVKFSSLPLKRWEYRSEEPGVEHIGPTAQDFWNAFHLGNEPLGISTIDADGVMMAAIQELAKENSRLQDRVARLEAMLQSQTAEQQQTWKTEK